MGLSWQKVFILSGITLGGGALAIITCGAAAPAVGAMLGGVMGLAGSAELAALGGGMIAAGGAAVAGGTVVAGGMLGNASALSCATGTCSTGLTAAGSLPAAKGGLGMAGGTGSAGAASANNLLGSDSAEFENLQTIAENLSGEIVDLKKTLENTAEHNTKTRDAIGKELAVKEAKLAVITDVFKV